MTLKEDLRMQRIKTLVSLIVCLTATMSWAQPAEPPAGGQPGGAPRRGPGRGPGRPIVLGPDDKPAVPDAPDGFNAAREGVARGKLEMI